MKVQNGGLERSGDHLAQAMIERSVNDNQIPFLNLEMTVLKLILSAPGAHIEHPKVVVTGQSDVAMPAKTEGLDIDGKRRIVSPKVGSVSLVLLLENRTGLFPRRGMPHPIMR